MTDKHPGDGDIGAAGPPHAFLQLLQGHLRVSAKVMERLGMRREAHLRQNEIVKGEWTDELVYAMLAHEWPTTRQQVPGR